MREIKFRAWNSLEGKYMYPYPEGFHVIGETTVFEMLKPLRVEDYQHLHIEQYTGLKDKNGKEAYHNDYWRDPRLPNVLYLIEENPQNGGFKLVCYIEGERIDSMSHTRTDLSCITKGEVIGNIHEENNDTKTETR